MSKCYVSYEQAERIISEGDILLFRHTGPLSTLVSSVTDSPYSHVGLVSWSDSVLECVEFREWVGSRAINLQNYVKNYPGELDIFTPHRYSIITHFDCSTRTRTEERVFFKGKKITNEFRCLTGIPYGWKRIWQIFSRKTYRIFFPYKNEFSDELADKIIYPICSSAVAYCYNKHYVDLVRCKMDELVTPGEIAKSSTLNYIATISKNETN